MKIDPDLLFPQVDIADRDELFALAGKRLAAGGYVLESWASALAEREESYPTGVQVSGGGVALPHTDVNHAVENTIAVATLPSPVTFEPMGGEGAPVEATTIIFLVFSDPKQHLKTLSGMVKAIRSEEFLRDLQGAATVEDMESVLTARLG